MLDFEEIKELLQLVADKRLEGIEIERAGFRLTINGSSRPGSVAQPIAAPVPTTEMATPEQVVAAKPAEDKTSVPDGSHVVTSPIVGTFYTSPSPDAEAYARVGDRVRQGQVLCIVEAMKLMNEIESDVDGVVVEIYPKNAQPVEFGEPLFAIQPA